MSPSTVACKPSKDWKKETKKKTTDEKKVSTFVPRNLSCAREF